MINDIYQNLLKEILLSRLQYDTQKYEGTDKMIAHPNSGYASFSVDPMANFPLISLRDINIKVFVAEIIWYLKGTKDASWLQKYTKIWNAFADDDGLVSSSYGYRWRNHFGRDQIGELVSLLQRDPSSRQGLVTTWDPKMDGLDTKRKKNVPCVPFFQAHILDGRLVLDVLFRSNDMYLGFPHDIGGFALLQAILAQKLNLQTGSIHWTIHHAHLYQNQLEQAKILATTILPQEVPIMLNLPPNSYEIAREGTDQEMDQLFEKIYLNLKEQYTPVQKLKLTKIVV